VDIAEIAAYLVERNPSAAAAVEARIRFIAELLAAFPASGRKLEQRPTVRVMPIGQYPYRIFYTVAGEEVVVLHVRHAAREPVDPSDI
jgi:plasmid stabilization system protein ParE